MIFNPEESIDFHGFTGPFIQYTFARIQSIRRKEQESRPGKEESQEFHKEPVQGFQTPAIPEDPGCPLMPLEKAVIFDLEKYPSTIETACAEMNPSVIANYAFDLAKIFNSFYTEHSITHAENPEKKQFRLQLIELTAIVIKSAMELLGIRVPDRM
jgi:arginyl-tRNA synthetase